MSQSPKEHTVYAKMLVYMIIILNANDAINSIKSEKQIVIAPHN